MNEVIVNGVIASRLQNMNSRWHVITERQVFLGTSQTPDILVLSYGRQPFVIETEWLPAYTVELDARSRLGKKLNPTITKSSEKIFSSIAVQLPNELKKLRLPDQVHEELKNNKCLQFKYALITSNEIGETKRFPKSEYLTGTLEDLANFINNASIPKDALSRSIKILSEGVEDVITTLKTAANQSENYKHQLSVELKQNFRGFESESHFEQMNGIAATVMINALMFQSRLAGNQGVLSIDQMIARNVFNQAGVLKEWAKILTINYWSIFKLASDLLISVNPTSDANRALRQMARTTRKLIDLGVHSSQDLAGTVFQRFIGDRKYLASYYTRPESAALLAYLIVPDVGWKDSNRMTKFSIADYSCGTGTLIHAAYLRLNQVHELAGGNPEIHHKKMMESVLTAVDIVPSAAHLTASMLSSVYPNVPYDNSNVIIGEYGRKQERNVAIGSLELLDKKTLSSFFDFGSPTQITGGYEKKTSINSETIAKKQQLIIMNPPFTRAMSDWEIGAEGSWKQYRGLGNSIEAQKEMKKRETELLKNTCFNGRAGIASAFAALADKMIEIGGSIALVLPLTSIHGTSWKGFRSMVCKFYQDLMVVAIASQNAKDQSWSADTSLVEVLLMAKKTTTQNTNESNRGIFITLYARPNNQMEAIEIGKEIKKLKRNRNSLKKIEDPPNGGSPIILGEATVGTAIEAQFDESPWHFIPVKDLSIAQSLRSLNQGNLLLPTMKAQDAVKLFISPIGEFARVGMAANNIANNKTAAFDRFTISQVPSYPMLWKRNSKIQKSMLVQPDMEGLIRSGKDEAAQRIWRFRSRVHHAAELGYRSQSLAAAYTETVTIGGRGWPNIVLPSYKHEKAYCLWANTTLGLAQYWYHASRQQGSRGIMPVTAIATMPFLNVNKLTEKQLDIADQIFEQMKNKRFKPAASACTDVNRLLLDNHVLFNLLGLKKTTFSVPIKLFRRKWCAEPSV